MSNHVDLAGVAAPGAAGANTNQQGAVVQTADMAATCATNLEMARQLFGRGASPNIRGEILSNPFLSSGAEGEPDIIMLPSEAPADPSNSRGSGDMQEPLRSSPTPAGPARSAPGTTSSRGR